MKKIATLLCLSLVLGACSSPEVEEGPLRDYLLEGRTEHAAPAPDAAIDSPAPAPDREPPAVVVEPPEEAPIPVSVADPVPVVADASPPEPPAVASEPFFVRYLGVHHYDVLKNVVFPFKGGEVVYRFRRIDDPGAYPPHASYLEFEFHIRAEGPGRLFMDEARFVAQSVYDGRELQPRLFRVGLADGSFRHLVRYEVEPDGRSMTVVNELTGDTRQLSLVHQDVVDPVTFFFNLFCRGVDMTSVQSLHGHLLHEREAPIIVHVDQDERVAEVGFGPGEFLPRKPSRFRFFFDDHGRIDVTRFELEYGSWSMRMERTTGPDVD